MQFIDTRTRSLVKTFSWRFAGTLITSGLVYYLTKKPIVSIAAGGVEAVLKSAVYFFHERFWNKIKWGKTEIPASVIWLTGLSGAGKSTIGQALANDLRKKGLKVQELDGDTLREIFPQTGFSREERDLNVRRAGYLASWLEKNGVFAVASLISPYEESRSFVRGLCKNFVEVYVSTPLDVCERRDPKGLYAKARTGEIRNFTGIDDPYETPSNPDLVIDTTNLDVFQSVDRINQFVSGQDISGKMFKKEGVKLIEFPGEA